MKRVNCIYGLRLFVGINQRSSKRPQWGYRTPRDSNAHEQPHGRTAHDRDQYDRGSM